MLNSLLKALTAVLVLAGVLVTGVVVSSALEPTGSAAWQHDPTIIPSVTCVDRLNDTDFRAHFEYENTTGSVVNIPGSPYNFFQIDGASPVDSTVTAFQPGAGNHGIDILASASVTWTVMYNSREVSVTATIEDPECDDQHPTTTTAAPTTTSTSTTVAPTTTSTTVAPTTTSTTVAPTTTTTEAPTTTTTSPTTTTCQPYVCQS